MAREVLRRPYRFGVSLAAPSRLFQIAHVCSVACWNLAAGSSNGAPAVHMGALTTRGLGPVWIFRLPDRLSGPLATDRFSGGVRKAIHFGALGRDKAQKTK